MEFEVVSTEEILKEWKVKEEKEEKIVLALLKQCKDEGMTVDDVKRICDRAVLKAQKTTLREGLTL